MNIYGSALVLMRRLIVAKFTVNAKRRDPYKGFKFRVKWDGRVVAGVSAVSGLRRTTELTTFREGSDPSASLKMPGRTDYEAITVSRGITHDATFEEWANKVSRFGSAAGVESSLADFRKDITIELLNEAGQVAVAYNVFRCWPSEYVALAELDANAPLVAIELLTLQNEGWERDASVGEPTEPSY